MSTAFEKLRAVPLEQVALAAGLTQRGTSWTPCPTCHADRRGSSDARGPIGFTANGRGWRCHRCKEGGDGVTLAAIASEAAHGQWDKVLAWAQEKGLLDGDLKQPTDLTPRVRKRPGLQEVEHTWYGLRAVFQDEAANQWLRRRSLFPRLVDELGLAMALPEIWRGPGWAARGPRGWAETGHRIVFSLWGATGERESLHARAVAVNAPRPKGLSPQGFEVKGLVFADALGVAMLRGDARPAQVVMAEGPSDFLSWATRWGDTPPDHIAILGVLSGSWTADLAAQIPDGAQVVLRTDPDPSGDKYAEQIASTLAGRCEIVRRR